MTRWWKRLQTRISDRQDVYYSFGHVAKICKTTEEGLTKALVDKGWLKPNMVGFYEPSSLARHNGFLHTIIDGSCNMGHGVVCFTEKGVNTIGKRE